VGGGGDAATYAALPPAAALRRGRGCARRGAPQQWCGGVGSGLGGRTLSSARASGVTIADAAAHGCAGARRGSGGSNGGGHGITIEGSFDEPVAAAAVAVAASDAAFSTSADPVAAASAAIPHAAATIAIFTAFSLVAVAAIAAAITPVWCAGGTFLAACVWDSARGSFG